MACEYSVDCPLYEKFSLSSTLKVWKINYCESNFETCERFKRTSRGKVVPATLLPNGKDLTDRASG